MELHEGDCGSHSSGRSLVLRAKRAGYYWPTMAEDANKKDKHYDRCQSYAPVSKLPPKNMKSISSPLSFRKWGVDKVGKFPMAPGQKVFLLIATGYFSKWVEAEALSRITDPNQQVHMDPCDHAFRVPHEIVTDNGPQFRSHNFKEFCKDWGIKLTFATPNTHNQTGRPSP